MDVWHATYGSTQWIKLQLPIQSKITKFAIKNRDWWGTDVITQFILEGSNDDTNWDSLTDTCSNPASSNTTTEFTVKNPGFYTYYRWRITGTNTGYAVIDEIWIRQIFGK